MSPAGLPESFRRATFLDLRLKRSLLVSLALASIGSLDSLSPFVCQALLYGLLCLWAGYRLGTVAATLTVFASIATHVFSTGLGAFSLDAPHGLEFCLQAIEESALLAVAAYLGYLQRRNQLLLKVSYEEVSRSRQEIHVRAVRLEQINREISQLQELSDLFQSVQDLGEVFRLLGPLLSRLLPARSGGLYWLKDSRDQLDLQCSWGQAGLSLVTMAPEECWCLRRGKTHKVTQDRQEFACPHWLMPDPKCTICLPIIGQGDILGVLSLALDCEISQETDRLLLSTREQLSMGLANLRLRESLRQQSIRDPLTGLFNRRFLDESISRELARAQRRQEGLGLVMLDVDHFKAFNDRYGHDAGDTVLQAVATYLCQAVRREDVVCRYGGEEFCILLPSISKADLEASMSRLCLGLSRLRLDSGPHKLTVTASFGAARFPEHGQNAEHLIRQADSALYEAKQAGRNCFRMAASGA